MYQQCLHQALGVRCTSCYANSVDDFPRLPPRAKCFAVKAWDPKPMVVAPGSAFVASGLRSNLPEDVRQNWRRARGVTVPWTRVSLAQALRDSADPETPLCATTPATTVLAKWEVPGILSADGSLTYSKVFSYKADDAGGMFDLSYPIAPAPQTLASRIDTWGRNPWLQYLNDMQTYRQLIKDWMQELSNELVDLELQSVDGAPGGGDEERRVRRQMGTLQLILGEAKRQTARLRSKRRRSWIWA